MEHEKLIKDAQYRKGLSIAYFNATNIAIELVKLEEHKEADPDTKKDLLRYWRDWLLEEHKNYYARVIANVGANYNAGSTIDRINATKSKEELRRLWLGLSEDERSDPAILEAKNAKKAIYEKK